MKTHILGGKIRITFYGYYVKLKIKSKFKIPIIIFDFTNIIRITFNI